VRETTLQTPRSVQKEGEEVLQVPERIFPCSPWGRPWWCRWSSCVQVSSSWTVVEQMSTLQPVEDPTFQWVDVPWRKLQSMESHTGAGGGCQKKGTPRLMTKTSKLVTTDKRRLRYSTNFGLHLHWQPLFPHRSSGRTTRQGLGEQSLSHCKRRSGSLQLQKCEHTEVYGTWWAFLPYIHTKSILF